MLNNISAYSTYNMPYDYSPAQSSNSSKTVNAEKDVPVGKLECETCSNRRYQDGSDDPGVSFKTPGKIDPNSAPSVVASHENEHVVREKADAKKKGGEIISQSVTFSYSICPECGRSYVSGGKTRTVKKIPSPQNKYEQNFNSIIDAASKGNNIDTAI